MPNKPSFTSADDLIQAAFIRAMRDGSFIARMPTKQIAVSTRLRAYQVIKKARKSPKTSPDLILAFENVVMTVDDRELQFHRMDQYGGFDALRQALGEDAQPTEHRTPEQEAEAAFLRKLQEQGDPPMESGGRGLPPQSLPSPSTYPAQPMFELPQDLQEALDIYKGRK